MSDNLYRTIGSRIREIRESKGMSQEELARAIGYTTAGAISHFEKGLRKVSVADLHHISSVLGVSVDYLTAADNQATLQSYRLRAIDVRPTQREAVAAFLAFAESNSEMPEEIADWVKIGKPWRQAENLLRQLDISDPPVIPAQVASQLGIRVFRWDFPDEISGILVFDENSAVIGVNNSHSYVRQNFTIAHELGHYILHSADHSYIDLSEIELTGVYFDESQQEQETEANQFAAALLMPALWVTQDFDEYGEEGLTMLAQRYEVSEQAMWFRLRNLRKLN